VVACNLIEEDTGEVRLWQGVFRFAIGPYEIRTFRLLL